MLENRGLLACAAGAGGLAVVAAPALVTAPVLSGLGFKAAGVWQQVYLLSHHDSELCHLEHLKPY